MTAWEIAKLVGGALLLLAVLYFTAIVVMCL